jgi:hypothetical protein
MTTSNEGWLALTEDGHVYAFDEQGSVDSVDLNERGLTFIEGISLNDFVAFESGTGFISMDGRREESFALPEDEAALQMWPNGEVWEINSLEGEVKSELDNWTRYSPPSEFYVSMTALGPGPDTRCANEGLWAGAGGLSLLKREPSEERWDQQFEAGGPEISAIGCDHNGSLLVGDWGGTVHRKAGDSWNRIDAAHTRIDSIAASDSTTYLAGKYGSLTTLRDDEVLRMTDGFQLPNGVVPEDDPFNDIWVNDDGSLMVLHHRTGLYRGSAQGWEPMTIDVESRGGGTNSQHADIWGIDEPTFAIYKRRLLRWTGSAWVSADIKGEASGSDYPVDIAGAAEDSVWLTDWNDQLYHYDGTSWQQVESEKMPQSNFIGTLSTTPGGEVLMAGDSTVYRLWAGDGDPSLEIVVENTPCDYVYDAFRTNTGALYVTGTGRMWPNEICVAKATDSGWKHFELRENVRNREDVWIPTGRQFIRQPDGRPPLVASGLGALAPREDGTLERVWVGELNDAAFVKDVNVALLLHRRGVVAKY